MGQSCIYAMKSELNVDDVNKCSQVKKRFRRLQEFFGRKNSKTAGEEREESSTYDTNSETSEGCAADLNALAFKSAREREDTDDFYSCYSGIVRAETLNKKSVLKAQACSSADRQTKESLSSKKTETEKTTEVRHRVEEILERLKLFKRGSEDEKQKTSDFKKRYKRKRLLGKGRFGSVFKGVRRSDGLKVAIKIVTKTEKTQYLDIPDHSDSLPKEIALMILLSKGPDVSQIIKLLDWYDEPQRYILVLERPRPCMDLHKYLYDHGGIIKEEAACNIMHQVTLAAIACSKRGVLHGDIKLQNVLVSAETGMVKLIDFGVGECLKDSPYTSYGGTKIYCPPEFSEKNEFHGDQATVWSLGMLLYRMVHGHYPNCHTQQDINNNVWTKNDVSEECCHLIHCCLQQEPQKRIKLKQILHHEFFKMLHKTHSKSDEKEEVDHQEESNLEAQACSSADRQTKESLSSKKTETEKTTEVRHRVEEILERLKLFKRGSEDEKQKTSDFEKRYKRKRLLGKGRFGSVFKGVRRSDGLKVAIKIVTKTEKTQYLDIPDHSDSLPKEIALMILLSKGPDVSQIIKLLDWYDEPQRYILVLERPRPCMDLHKYLYDRGGIIKEEAACYIMHQVTLAAIACSKRGVLHGDIKLQNVLVTAKTGMVKLIDFGVGECLKDSPYTSYGGTKICCPPEFSEKNEFHGDQATVWSLGMLLYRMVHGHYPDCHTQQDINNNLWTKNDVSEECCHLIHCCLQQEPQKRIKLKQILHHEFFKMLHKTHSKSDEEEEVDHQEESNLEAQACSSADRQTKESLSSKDTEMH